MKLGFVSAILDGWTFEGMVDTAAEMGFASASRWPAGPAGKAERRYAGVSHIDVERVLDDDAGAATSTAISRSSRAWKSPPWHTTPTPWTATWKSAPPPWQHLKKVIRASRQAGREPGDHLHRPRSRPRPWRRTSILMCQVWPPILKLAEELGVRIAIENCPMLFGAGPVARRTEPDDHPGDLAARYSSALPSPNLGINYDPSALRMAA